MVFLSTLIFLKNLLFFGKVWQIKEYRLDRVSDWLQNENGFKVLFNKIFFIYLIIFLFGLFGFDILGLFSHEILFEKIFYYLVFFLFLIEIFFIFFKLFQNKLIVPKFTGRFSLIFLVSILFNFIILYFIGFNFDNILFIIFLLNSQFLVFLIGIFLTYPITRHLKLSIVSNARNKIFKFKNLKKVAITGSYGKSTVKEFLFQIFEKNFSTMGTFKNQNTPLGISNLILNKLDDGYEYFFCEMGAYKQGEIEELGDIVDHKYGFLTGINNQHLSLFGSQANIVLGKSEIAKNVAKNGGILYVNGDNFYCKKAQLPRDLNVVYYGLDGIFNSAFSEIIDFSEKGIVFNFYYKGEKNVFSVNIIGKHNISNLTGVLAFCFDQGLNKDKIQDALNSLKTPEKNLELTKKNLNDKKEIFLINDTYNINYDGVLSACESLDIFKNVKKVLVLDDILELGSESRNIHFELGKEIAKFNFDEVCLIGREFDLDVKRGLIDGGFSVEKIFHYFIFDYLEKNLLKDKNDLSERCIFLFEGMHSEKYFNKINSL